jgi:hypothetical protein
VNASGALVVGSARPHYLDIVKFIKRHIDAVPSAELFRNNPDSRIFYIIYWILYLGLADPPAILYECINVLVPNLTQKDVQNKLYCMRLARWIEVISYSEKDYYFVFHPKDPFDYSFKAQAADRDVPRRRSAASAALSQLISAPKHVRRIANDHRMRSVR